jgi:membrane protein required for colicin V production
VNTLDLVIAIVLGVSTLSALWRGLISEVMSLVVWALALWTAATFSGSVAESTFAGVEPPSLRIGSAYLVLFFGVLISGGVLTWTLKRILKKTGMSSMDRSLGALFGLLRGLLIVFSAVLFAGFTQLPKQPFWRESALMPTIQNLAMWSSQHLPESVRNYVKFPHLDDTRPLEAPAASSPKAAETDTRAP